MDDYLLAQVQHGEVGGLILRLMDDNPTDLSKRLHAKAMVVAAWNDDAHTLHEIRHGERHVVLAALCVAAHWGSCAAATVLLRTQPSWSSELVIGKARRWVTPLSLAAEAGHVAMVQLLLDWPGVCYPLGDALRCAVLARHADVVRVLMDAGAPPGDEFVAALSEPLDVLEVLIRHKANPDEPQLCNGLCNNAMWYAVKDGHVPAVAFLLRSKVDANLGYQHGATLLWSAATDPENAPACLQLLLAAKADIDAPNEDGGRPLHAAAQTMANDCAVDVLLAAKANVGARNGRGETALHAAARFAAGTYVLEALLAARASVNDETWTGKTALHTAVTHDRRAQVATLMAAKADVYAPGILETAVRRGHALCLQEMLDAGAVHRAPREDLGALCFAAIESRCCGTLATLLGAKVSCHARTAAGETPLHCALGLGDWKESPAILHLLLYAKADAGAVASDGTTPLHRAVASGTLAFVRLLVGAGAPFDSEAEDEARVGATAPPPLFAAARRGRARVVRALLGMKALATRTWQGWTPLHAAAAEDRDDVVRILLAHEPALKGMRTVGARVHEGRTIPPDLLPVDLARLLKHDDTIAVLSTPGEARGAR